MGTIIHRPVLVGHAGKVDSLGYGSRYSRWDYPTLGLKEVITKGSCGGACYPRIEGVDCEDMPGRPIFTVNIDWDSPVIYRLSGGRTLRPVVVDGLRCFEETVTA